VPPSEAKPDLHEKDKVKASRWPRRTGRHRNCVYIYISTDYTYLENQMDCVFFLGTGNLFVHSGSLTGYLLFCKNTI
jgi:hypothetical protein